MVVCDSSGSIHVDLNLLNVVVDEKKRIFTQEARGLAETGYPVNLCDRSKASPFSVRVSLDTN